MIWGFVIVCLLLGVIIGNLLIIYRNVKSEVDLLKKEIYTGSVTDCLLTERNMLNNEIKRLELENKKFRKLLGYDD